MVLGGNGPRQPGGNLLIDEILGAEMIHCSQADRPAEVESALKRLKASGHQRYSVGGVLRLVSRLMLKASRSGTRSSAKLATRCNRALVAVVARKRGWLSDSTSRFAYRGLGISVDHSKEVLTATVETLIVQLKPTQISLRAKASARYSADYLGHGYEALKSWPTLFVYRKA